MKPRPRLNNLLGHFSVVGVFAGGGDSICRLERHVDSLKKSNEIVEIKYTRVGGEWEGSQSAERLM